MKLEEAKKICNEIIRINMFNRNTDANAIEAVLQALDNKDKQLQEISDEFLKYDWANSNSIQINNQLKSLYFSIFRKEKVEE